MDEPTFTGRIATELVTELRRAADTTVDEETSGKLRRAADAVAALDHDVLVGIVGEAIGTQGGQ